MFSTACKSTCPCDKREVIIIIFFIIIIYLFQWAERQSPNKMRITAQSGRAWTENPDHPHYQAAARATKLIYQVTH